jgi:hypothetical protein
MEKSQMCGSDKGLKSGNPYYLSSLNNSIIIWALVGREWPIDF